MGGGAQKLDDIVATSPISRLFSRNNKVTWGYLAREITTICSKWRVVKCLSTRSVGLGRRHSQVRIGRRKCNCLQKQTPFHEYHSKRRDGLLWPNKVRYHVAEGYTRIGSGLYISEVHMDGRTLELLRLPRICESITRAQCGLVLLSFG